MRTLVIGDIHGGLKALEQVLERCNYNPESDKLIFLGDYVDGWSQSAEVIDFLIRIKNWSKIPPIFIRGNHDKWCEDWLHFGQTHLIWTQQGGQSTIDSYIRTGLLLSDDHRKFFREMVNYHIDDLNRGFVHAGFHSRKGLGHEVYNSDYYWDRDLWQIAFSSHNQYCKDKSNISNVSQYTRFLKHKEIFIGHTSTGNWDVKPHYPEYDNLLQKKNGKITIPMNRCNVWNLDTGAGFEGKLTIMDIDSKEFYQSDLVSELYPDEKGR